MSGYTSKTPSGCSPTPFAAVHPKKERKHNNNNEDEDTEDDVNNKSIFLPKTSRARRMTDPLSECRRCNPEFLGNDALHPRSCIPVPCPRHPVRERRITNRHHHDGNNEGLILLLFFQHRMMETAKRCSGVQCSVGLTSYAERNGDPTSGTGWFSLRSGAAASAASRSHQRFSPVRTIFSGRGTRRFSAVRRSS